MPQYTQHHSSKYIKLLGMAESGTGKTGSLAALANAGYKLAILDFDNGLDILHEYVRPEFLENIYYITLQDTLSIASVKSNAAGKGKGVRGDILSYNPLKMPTAYPRALKLLNRWKEPAGVAEDGTEIPAIDLGKTQDLGDGWFVVVDSATAMGEASLLYTLAVNQHEMPEQADYGDAMNRQQKLTEMLCSADFKANVIILCHVHQVGSEKEAKVGGGELGHKYPSYLGTKLPPKVAGLFNTVISYESVGSGKRQIVTSGISDMSLKSSASKSLERRYPLELDKEGYAINGLAKVVETIKKAMQ